ncbi:MAG: plasmid mobilization relaxosome protein MobC, partial [Clostridia bacterium]|nr:plasmid mobilization relaxosome protein MobC [Clostridia bacterium]
VKNSSAFFRAMVLNGYLLRLDLPELRKAARLMGRLSNNVNQIARRMNERGNIYDTEIDDIVQGEKEIVETMGQILDRLNHISEKS